MLIKMANVIFLYLKEMRYRISGNQQLECEFSMFVLVITNYPLGPYFCVIWLAGNAMKVGLMNMIYSMRRFAFLRMEAAVLILEQKE